MTALPICEMIRTLKSRPGRDGYAVIFCPNRGYPFETHGIYWNGKYHFGNKLFVNYLPRTLRNKLAPHVRVYSRTDLQKLFEGLPVKFIERNNYLWRVRQYHCEVWIAGKNPAWCITVLGKDTIESIGFVPFLGSRKTLGDTMTDNHHER